MVRATVADGTFHGILCQRTATAPAAGSCATTKSLAIGSSNIIVMSGNHANVTREPRSSLYPAGARSHS